MNSKLFILALVLVFLPHLGFSKDIPSTIEKTTKVFAVKDTSNLKMDIYKLKSQSDRVQPCMIFVFGGGFISGKRDSKQYNDYFTVLAEKGITVVSIDYRLGLRGIKKAPSVTNTKPMYHAVDIAVEDLFSATKYLLDNAGTLNIDAKLIMISGSSAGAITVLQSDYVKRNTLSGSEILPADFQYSGVLAFAGAIASKEGTPNYKIAPALTLFFHGDKDVLVPYGSKRLFRKGLFGSKSLAKKFKKEGYAYCFFTVEGLSHEIAESPMVIYHNQIISFIDEYIFDEKPWQMEIKLNDASLKPGPVMTIKSLYK